ncbi:hypothetical protein ACP70R_012197 [Stipagrostis hirtigluma subsp. patula]
MKRHHDHENTISMSSPEKLSDGDVVVEYERQMSKAEARQLFDWVLWERAQRWHEELNSGISARLPDSGKKLLLFLEASLRELNNQSRDARGLWRLHGSNGKARVPDKVMCQICGSSDISKCILSDVALPLFASSEDAKWRGGHENGLTTSSLKKLFGGEARVGDERKRTEAEVPQLQEATAGCICAHPNGGKRLCLLSDASLGELNDQCQDPQADPCLQDGSSEAQVPDEAVCEICGNGSYPNLIANCIGCNNYEHCYCMQVATFVVPDEWYCNSCQERLTGQLDVTEALVGFCTLRNTAPPPHIGP